MDMTELRAQWRKYHELERPEREAAAHPLMKSVSELMEKINKDGWRSIIYCPRDNTLFWAWDPSYPTPYCCSYDGRYYLAYMDGDAWPAHPVLWRPKETQ